MQREHATGLQIAYHDAGRDTIAEGCQAGEFRVTDVSLVTMAILDMLNGIRGWYSPAGRLGRDEVIARYTGPVFTMLGADQGSGRGRAVSGMTCIRGTFTRSSPGVHFSSCVPDRLSGTLIAGAVT